MKKKLMLFIFIMLCPIWVYADHIYNIDMDKKIVNIKKQIEKEETIFKKLEKQLHSNPIRMQFNKFITSKLKLSVLDLLKDK